MAAAGVAALPLVVRRRPSVPGRALTAAAIVVSLAAGTGATLTVIDVGHSGAEATWGTIGVGGDDDD